MTPLGPTLSLLASWALELIFLAWTPGHSFLALDFLLPVLDPFPAHFHLGFVMFPLFNSSLPFSFKLLILLLPFLLLSFPLFNLGYQCLLLLLLCLTSFFCALDCFPMCVNCNSVQTQTPNTKPERHHLFTSTPNTSPRNINNTFPHHNHRHPIGTQLETRQPHQPIIHKTTDRLSADECSTHDHAWCGLLLTWSEAPLYSLHF